jgi:hypothetical protein
LNKKDQNSSAGESIPEILEIEEQEIEERKPPNEQIINYEIISGKDNSDIEKEEI